MRYYTIQIGDSSSGTAQATYTSFPNNQTDPGALQIEMDIPTAPANEVQGNVGGWVKIYGVSLQEIAQGRNLNGLPIKVFGGMQKGLPLANPAQAGLLAQGFIFQAFANWLGTEQAVQLVLLPGMGTRTTPKNIIVNWQKGQTMAQALEIALKQAFPNFTRTINIDPKLVLPESAWGVYQTVPQLAQWTNQKSKAIIGRDDYLGVNIFIKENAVIVYDGTTQSAATTIAFTDLIGQVTWKAPGLIQVTCVMRAKPGIGDIITLPPGQITINQASLSQFRQGSIFQGNFMISAVRHVGNFRQPAAEAWVTTYDCVPVPNSTGGAT